MNYVEVEDNAKANNKNANKDDKPRKLVKKKRIGEKTITSKAVLTEAGNYAVIVGNDWLKKT
ncbi:11032_t:CDS:2 [Gigaspora margarita]|uniref:11032_t:CDS:1 n=1 Tax=Gigaspora margarita TaxID=4874 RepID=A0ABN7V040_GIGMA|nr:11032_t:CDS:2 [Gigaspora margarita]